MTTAQFLTTYANAAGSFLNNTTRLITPTIMRQFATDIASLFGNIVVGTVDTTVVTLVLNADSGREAILSGSASIAAIKTWSVSNVTNAYNIRFRFALTAVFVQTFPSNFKMELWRGDWVDSTKEWTPNGAGSYEANMSFDGTNWYVNIAGPY